MPEQALQLVLMMISASRRNMIRSSCYGRKVVTEMDNSAGDGKDSAEMKTWSPGSKLLRKAEIEIRRMKVDDGIWSRMEGCKVNGKLRCYGGRSYCMRLWDDDTRFVLLISIF